MCSTSPSGELFNAAAILRSLFPSMNSTAPERWRREVARAIGTTVSATRVGLIVGEGPLMQVYDDRAMATPSVGGRRFVHPAPGVWCRRAGYDAVGAPPAAYDRVAYENLLYDAVGITVVW